MVWDVRPPGVWGTLSVILSPWSAALGLVAPGTSQGLHTPLLPGHRHVPEADPGQQRGRYSVLTYTEGDDLPVVSITECVSKCLFPEMGVTLRRRVWCVRGGFSLRSFREENIQVCFQNILQHLHPQTSCWSGAHRREGRSACRPGSCVATQAQGCPPRAAARGSQGGVTQGVREAGDGPGPAGMGAAALLYLSREPYAEHPWNQGQRTWSQHAPGPWPVSFCSEVPAVAGEHPP